MPSARIREPKSRQEWSPLTATLLALVLEAAGVRAGVFNVVQVMA